MGPAKSVVAKFMKYLNFQNMRRKKIREIKFEDGIVFEPSLHS